jgi:uncharacterized membrane protein
MADLSTLGIPAPEEVSSDAKLWALLAYLLCPLFGILILVMDDKKNDPFMRFHAVQSIALSIAIIVLSWICIGVLVWFYAIYLGLVAYKGQVFEIPFITNFCQEKGWFNVS